MFKIKDTQFCMENLKMKEKKKEKTFLTFQNGGSNLGFSKISLIRIIEGDGI